MLRWVYRNQVPFGVKPMNLRLPSPSDISGKRVVVRVDFNVPLQTVDGQTTVVEDKRLQAIIPTLRFLLQNQAKIILISHLGRPAGTGFESEFSLAPVATHLQTLLPPGTQVQFNAHWRGAELETATAALAPGQILLAENIRFDAGEEKNDPSFAQDLAKLGEVFINDAFSVSHRAHASVVGISQHLPSFAGMALAAEVNALSDVRDNPHRPLVVVIGGAKISDKVEAVVNLAHLADVVLIGGGIANNFLKADGLEIHKSFVQDAPADLKKKGVDYIHVAQDLITQMKTERVWVDGFIPVPKILYPLDVVAATSPDATETQIIDLTHDAADTPLDQELMYLDIGPKTIKLYQELIATAGTVFWNGPMGMFEKELFATGTREIAQAIANTSHTAETILGGGDTVTAIEKFGLTDQYSYVSAAGGASLEFLAGKELPGLKVLEKQ